MSRSLRKREDYEGNSGRLRESRYDGTAARTRPFSFEEIMKKRKNKELSHTMKEVGKMETSWNVTVRNSSPCPESSRGGRETKRLSSIIERPVLEENVRVSTRSEEDSLHMKIGKSSSGIHGGKGQHLSKLQYKEEHVVLKLGMDLEGNRKNRESGAQLQINEVGSSDKRNETDKNIHSRSKNDELHRVDTGDRFRTDIRSTVTTNDQKIFGRGGVKNDERPRNYREDKAQRDELRSRGNRVEIDEKIISRSKNNERPRHNAEDRRQGSELRNKFDRNEMDKRIYRRKGDERPRNDLNDRGWKTYSREPKVFDRHAGKIEEKPDKESKRKHYMSDDNNIRDRNAAKKHDLGRSHESEVPRKRGKEELLAPLYEETRMNRKRSRSRDRGKEKDRLLSLSPEAQKHISYSGKKFGGLSAHSLKDRPEKPHKDIERSKLPSNGSGNHYRGHAMSASGLGGYSPRKRKTENAVKTPSPKNRSPERKSAGWDIPPTGVKDSFNGIVTHDPQLSHQAVSLNVHELVSAVTAALNASKPLSGAAGFPPAKNSASIDSIQLTESTRPMRRLYVENIPASASEKDILEHLNNHLLSSGVNHIQGKQPCISCIIHKEKCQALVEFLTPEDASAALSFDGSSFSGAILKIRRPKDFVGVATGDVEAAKSVAAVPLSNIVKDSPHKVFVGGISEIVSTEMLIEIASAFGLLKAFHFDTTQDFAHRYAFLEYADQSVTLRACAGLNGMKLGGQVLTVVQASPYTSPEDMSEKQPTYVIPDHAKPLLQRSTEVIRLTNVFTPDDMLSLSKSEVEAVMEDIRLECSRFGTVKSLNVVERDAVAVNIPEEACGDHNEAKSAEGTRENRGDGLEIFSGNSGEVTEFVTSPGDVEVERVMGEKVETGDAVEPRSTSHEESVNDVKRNEDESSKSLDIKMDSNSPPSDLPSPESPSQPSILVDNIKLPEGKESETHQIKEDGVGVDSAGKEEFTLKAGKSSNARQESVGLLYARNGEPKEQESEVGHVFELGSVFVEYKRTESSCIAAHTLHGRLFDDRIVMAEYVPLELYHAKFPG